MQRGWKLDDILECPLYLAYLMMGGITRDKSEIKFSERDSLNYQVAWAKKQRETQAWQKKATLH